LWGQKKEKAKKKNEPGWPQKNSHPNSLLKGEQPQAASFDF